MKKILGIITLLLIAGGAGLGIQRFMESRLFTGGEAVVLDSNLSSLKEAQKYTNLPDGWVVYNSTDVPFLVALPESLMVIDGEDMKTSLGSRKLEGLLRQLGLKDQTEQLQALTFDDVVGGIILKDKGSAILGPLGIEAHVLLVSSSVMDEETAKGIIDPLSDGVSEDSEILEGTLEIDIKRVKGKVYLRYEGGRLYSLSSVGLSALGNFSDESDQQRNTYFETMKESFVIQDNKTGAKLLAGNEYADVVNDASLTIPTEGEFPQEWRLTRLDDFGFSVALPQSYLRVTELEAKLLAKQAKLRLPSTPEIRVTTPSEVLVAGSPIQALGGTGANQDAAVVIARFEVGPEFSISDYVSSVPEGGFASLGNGGTVDLHKTSADDVVLSLRNEDEVRAIRLIYRNNALFVATLVQSGEAGTASSLTPLAQSFMESFSFNGSFKLF